jgi:hypothetical protein
LHIILISLIFNWVLNDNESLLILHVKFSEDESNIYIGFSQKDDSLLEEDKLEDDTIVREFAKRRQVRWKRGDDIRLFSYLDQY